MTYLQELASDLNRFIAEGKMRATLFHPEMDDSLAPITVIETRMGGNNDKWKFYMSAPFYGEETDFVVEQSDDLRVIIKLTECGLSAHLQEWEEGQWVNINEE
jgi:hypothetical protein